MTDEPMTEKPLTVDQIRGDMLIALGRYAEPVAASLAASFSERWTPDEFVAVWEKTIDQLIETAKQDAKARPSFTTRLAAQHLADNVLGRPLLTLDDSDRAALRKVLDFVAARVEED